MCSLCSRVRTSPPPEWVNTVERGTPFPERIGKLAEGAVVVWSQTNIIFSLVGRSTNLLVPQLAAFFRINLGPVL
jgi:hypothetical protein